MRVGTLFLLLCVACTPARHEVIVVQAPPIPVSPVERWTCSVNLPGTLHAMTARIVGQVQGDVTVTWNQEGRSDAYVLTCRMNPLPYEKME